MLLACDIGNTNIKTGLFKGDTLAERKMFKDSISFGTYLQSISVDKIAASSVVPAITNSITKTCKELKNITPFIISREALFNLEVNYNSPETLGIDRLCSAEGAFYLYGISEDYNNYQEGTYILSVDLGTATTINVVSYPGLFTGGIIAPGITMMFESLNKNTAQLPNASEKYYDDFIGQSTFSSIASGVLNSAAGLIKSTIEYLKSDRKAASLKIFITGGNAEKLIPYLNFEFKYVPELVLLGVKTIYEKNNRNKKSR